MPESSTPSSVKPDQAFILAAGFGTRMRPLTDTIPKPMVEVAGQSLLLRILDHLAKSGITKAVINTHYLADKIENHVKHYKDVHIDLSNETEILDTGGGMKKMLAYFKSRPFFAINGDALWTEGPDGNALKRLASCWDDHKMDALLLLQKVEDMTLTKGIGDYDIKPDGRIERNPHRTGAYMFTGIRLHHPRIFKQTPDGAFSYLECMDQAQAQGRLFGLVHSGSWHHISTPEDLKKADDAFRNADGNL